MTTAATKPPADLAKQITAILAQLQSEVEQELAGLMAASTESPDGFRKLELRLAELGRRSMDHISGAALKEITGDRALEREAVKRLRASGRYRKPERRGVTVKLLAGSHARVRTAYVRRDLSGRRGRRRGTGKRGKNGTGHYPVLAMLGILGGVSPAAADEIALQVSASDSVRAARAALDRRGLDFGHKETLRIFNHTMKRALAHQRDWLHEAAKGDAVRGPFRGRRVVITTDGGRIRLRVPARAGRKNAKTGHRRFAAPWKEPKLLTIYVVDDDGEVIAKQRPIHDATLGDADAIFEMLVGYLKALGGHEAQEIIVLGDGALWIWNRADSLANRLGIAADKLKQVVDWYHAVETLGKIAAARKTWNGEETKKKWLKKSKNLLWRGDIDALVSRIDELGVGRSAKGVRKHRDYFARNAHRMQYESFRKQKLPIGSGAVESAVRRIVNLRMKGNSKYWLADNAEGMLLARSYLKAGRLDELLRWSHRQSIQWWDDSLVTPDGPLSPVLSVT